MLRILCHIDDEYQMNRLRLLWMIGMGSILLGLVACQPTQTAIGPTESPDTSPTPLAKPNIPAAFLAGNDTEPAPTEPPAPTPVQQEKPTGGGVQPAPPVDPPATSGGKKPCTDYVRTRIRTLEDQILTLNRDIKLTNNTDQRQDIRSEIKDYETTLAQIRRSHDCN